MTISNLHRNFISNSISNDGDKNALEIDIEFRCRIRYRLLQWEVMSSAYKYIFENSLSLEISLMYIKNISGPNLLPWGTPLLIN